MAPSSGSAAAGAADELAVTVDATGLPPGVHRAQVCVRGNDPATPLVGVPVTVTVAEVACDRTVTGRHLGTLVVPEGVTCLAEGARVIGGIRVESGAGLFAAGARVTGPVTATGADLVSLRDTRLTGPVTATATTGSLSLAGNRVTGPVRLTGNTTGATPIVVSANRIAGGLSCDGNQPPPVDLGDPNQVRGPMTGQCADR